MHKEVVPDTELLLQESREKSVFQDVSEEVAVEPVTDKLVKQPMKKDIHRGLSSLEITLFAIIGVLVVIIILMAML